MSDIVLLENILLKKQAQYPDGLDSGEIFEIFVADTILKNYSLSYTNLEDGIVDGDKDGGIDSIYLFANGVLITEDSDFSNYKQSVLIQVYIFQSTRKDSFKEAVINSLQASLPKLFDLSNTDKTLEPLFNPAVRSKFSLLGKAFAELSETFPVYKFTICYACRGNNPTKQMRIKADEVRDAISEKHSNADIQFKFLGAGDLYKEARTYADVIISLQIYANPLSLNNAYVALVHLSDYNAFISSSNQLSERLFEFNVRDYEGGGVQVNKQIKATLEQQAGDIDFWWLNNGVTILAENVHHQNNKLVLKNPVIVNGLQTSNEVYNYFEGKNGEDKRHILVRVVQTDTDAVRDCIIKATNSQTRIKESSLRATEELQRRIEDYLKTKSIYYDRRKNFYKNRGKPANQIIGIDRLAQSVMSVLLHRPDFARARPGTIIKDDDEYNKMFTTQHEMELYVVCARLNFSVEKYLRDNRNSIESIYRNNLKFHTMMVLAWQLLGKKSSSPKALSGIDVSSIDEKQVSKAFKWVKKEFDNAGPEDATAKDKNFVKRLKKNWK